MQNLFQSLFKVVILTLFVFSTYVFKAQSSFSVVNFEIKFDVQAQTK